MAALVKQEQIDGLISKLSDPEWRLFSGELYYIIVKDDNDPESEGTVMPFKPNRAQRRFISRLWHRNVILKARQLGFTTLIAILWLDYALFNPNARCGIIAQTDEIALNIFRDKVKFAYESLPPEVLAMFPVKQLNAHEIVFAHNNASIRVATSMRGGTIHRLHVSEFGKICAQFPHKATEVITGSIPAVPITGVLVIESTAEGKDGAFYKICTAAEKLFTLGRKPNPKQYRFHFFGWYEDEGYRISNNVLITQEDHDYFDSIENTMRVKIDDEQRAWYIATRNEFEEAGEPEKMMQEYPSTPKEAFQKSLAGAFYPKEMQRVRAEKRICHIPILDIPSYTFWDIGGTAGTAIWIFQQVGLEDRAIYYYEAHGESYSHFVKYLKDLDLNYERHFLPHDADHERQLTDENKSPRTMLEDAGLKDIYVLPRIENLEVGIALVRKYFPTVWFDEKRCAKGIDRIDGYKRKFNTKQGTYMPDPEKHDGNSEAADALRQWAQAKDSGLIAVRKKPSESKRRSGWRTA